MRIIKAEAFYDAMSKEEVEQFLAKPLLMRIGLIDKDGYPFVHPVWFLYKDEEFFISTNEKSKKAMLLKDNPKVYFTIDVDKPTGVRGKGDAIIINDKQLAVQLMQTMILRYLGNMQSKISQILINEAKQSVVIKIKPKFLATWTYNKFL